VPSISSSALPSVRSRLAGEWLQKIPEWELEEMIRDVIGYNFRPDIADRALAWLDLRIDAYKRLHGTLQ